MPWHHERGWSVVGSFRSLELKQSFATKHYVFEHSCISALVVAALSYNIPDSRVLASHDNERQHCCGHVHWFDGRRVERYACRSSHAMCTVPLLVAHFTESMT